MKLGLFWDAVAAPTSISVTWAVEVAVDVPGAYCTVIVQLPPGLTTAPDTQLPPVIEKVPVPAVLVMVGAAVSVSGPAFAPVAVLVTVMVPLFVVVLAVAVAKEGEGPANVTVAPVTVNVTPLAVPFGVLTVMLCAPSEVAGAMLSVAVTVVALTATKLVTVMLVDPGAFTAVAPVRSAPVRVTFTALPRTPVLGEIEVSAGPVTVKVTALLVEPAVVTVTFLAPSAAVDEMVKVAVTVLASTLVMPLTTTPPPGTATVEVPARLVPIRVTVKEVPRAPVFGEIELSVGAATVVVLWNSTAPTSISVGLPGSGLGLPKKSVCG